MQWISVEEKMPKEDELVLVANDERQIVSMAMTMDNCFVTISDLDNFEELSDGVVTHWMAFPKPPSYRKD